VREREREVQRDRERELPIAQEQIQRIEKGRPRFLPSTYRALRQ
jgi:hypothetical protein